jgi:pectate lyase
MSNLFGAKLSRRRLWQAVGLAAAVPAAATTGVLFASPAQAQETWYNIRNRHSGLYLDIRSGSTADGAVLQLYTANGGNNQAFQLRSSGNGYYRIQARHSGKVLDVYEWNPENGADIVQWTDTGAENQQWTFSSAPDGYHYIVNRFSGKALDNWEWATAAGSRVSQYDPNQLAAQQWALVPVGATQTSLVGWATQNGGTTGGGGAGATTVTSASALASAVSGSSAKVVRVSGTINVSGMINVGSNTTIVGNSGAQITGGGFHLSGSHNVIIQNLRFNGWSDDAINIQDGSTNVWVDHNTFGSGYDGSCDIKRESDFITVSWNRFDNSDKNMLLGHSDSHTADIGNLRVTYHHNYFNSTQQRNPRVRFGEPVHIYNNYYYDIGDYGVATTMNAGVIFEGNYIENTESPTEIGQGDSAGGRIVSRNNHLVNSGAPVSSGSVAGVPYSFTLDTPSNVKSIVTSGAGAR